MRFVVAEEKTQQRRMRRERSLKNQMAVSVVVATCDWAQMLWTRESGIVHVADKHEHKRIHIHKHSHTLRTQSQLLALFIPFKRKAVR